MSNKFDITPTQEMVDAGTVILLSALRNLGDTNIRDLATTIFEAMLNAAPDTTTSPPARPPLFRYADDADDVGGFYDSPLEMLKDLGDTAHVQEVRIMREFWITVRPTGLEAQEFATEQEANDWVDKFDLDAEKRGFKLDRIGHGKRE